MIFLEKNFLQVRMASGEEMICEVMEWPDEHSKEMVVRNAMMLTISWTEDEDQIYGLRPWMTMQENNMDYMVINPDHIVSTSKPVPMFCKEYIDAVDEMHQTGKQRTVRLRQRNEEDERTMASAIEKLSSYRVLENISDSDYGNVLMFPDPKTTLH